MTSITPRLNRSREGRDGSYPLVIQIIRHRKKREIYTPYRFWEAEFNTRLEMVETSEAIAVVCSLSAKPMNTLYI